MFILGFMQLKEYFDNQVIRKIHCNTSQWVYLPHSTQMPFLILSVGMRYFLFSTFLSFHMYIYPVREMWHDNKNRKTKSWYTFIVQL